MRYAKKIWMRCVPLVDSYRERLKGKKVGIILCGSNIDVGGYAKQMQQGELAIANGIFEGI